MADQHGTQNELPPLEKSSNPYLQPVRSPKKAPPGSKSSHISTIKSLGLLHDLQVCRRDATWWRWPAHDFGIFYTGLHNFGRGHC